MQQTKVRPSIPLGHSYTKLTPLDQYMVRVILPMMCVFQLDSDVDRSSVVQNLQAGLIHTIDEINILAAYVVLEDPRRGTIQLEFEEDAGITFFVKDMPEVRFEDLAKRHFPFSGMEASGYCPEPLGHTEKSPVMTVQVTFITGGLVLTFNGHHSVLDYLSHHQLSESCRVERPSVLADGGHRMDRVRRPSCAARVTALIFLGGTSP